MYYSKPEKKELNWNANKGGPVFFLRNGGSSDRGGFYFDFLFVFSCGYCHNSDLIRYAGKQRLPQTKHSLSS